MINGYSKGLEPSVAMKFFRDGRPSANQLGKVRHGKDIDNWNFFEKDFESQIAAFGDDQCAAKSVQRFNATKKNKYIFATGTVDTARYKENGS